jgi:hypothetical protein
MGLKIMEIHRGTCTQTDCNRKRRYKGKHISGKRRYGLICDFHHMRTYSAGSNQHLDNTRCASCGWDQSNCDRHRLVADGKYVPENVVILCPNCHRLVHQGKIGAETLQRAVVRV